MDQNAKKGLQFFGLHAIICLFRLGGLAQLVRAPASHAGGLGFESLILHHQKNPNTSRCSGSFLFEMAYLAFRCLWMKCSALAGLLSEANQKTRQVYPETGCTCFFDVYPGICRELGILFGEVQSFGPVWCAFAALAEIQNVWYRDPLQISCLHFSTSYSAFAAISMTLLFSMLYCNKNTAAH